MGRCALRVVTDGAVGLAPVDAEAERLEIAADFAAQRLHEKHEGNEKHGKDNQATEKRERAEREQHHHQKNG